jgi:3-phenylpropionate/cinnamic acid dioxygenase small subunit
MAAQLATLRPTKPTVESLLLVREVEEFLYYEANLLDGRRFEEWLDLLTEDVRYSMPLARNFRYGEPEREWTRELQDLCWFDEGKTTLTQRVQQIMTGIHWAEEPPSRVSHLVTNVEVVNVHPSLSEPGEVEVQCRFLVYRNRLQTETDLLVGKRRDTLRRVEGAWRLARREIYLDQNVLLAKNLTLFL